MRLTSVLCCALIVSSPAATGAQTSPPLLYSNAEYRFAVMFPGQPGSRDVSFTMGRGKVASARQFSFEEGARSYRVTVVYLPAEASVDDAIVETAAEQLRKRGKILFQFAFGYDPGVPGRQLNIIENNGQQLRASVYMWDHRLYITEASATLGATPVLQFEQSITLLDANGNELDTGEGSPPFRA